MTLTGKITHALRMLWMCSPERKLTKRRARVARTELYLCASCRRPKPKVEVDHIEPVGSTADWNAYIQRLFCDASGLRVLCLDCHRARRAKP